MNNYIHLSGLMFSLFISYIIMVEKGAISYDNHFCLFVCVCGGMFNVCEWCVWIYLSLCPSLVPVCEWCVWTYLCLSVFFPSVCSCNKRLCTGNQYDWLILIDIDLYRLRKIVGPAAHVLMFTRCKCFIREKLPWVSILKFLTFTRFPVCYTP